MQTFFRQRRKTGVDADGDKIIPDKIIPEDE
jgi:hypothetical protein